MRSKKGKCHDSSLVHSPSPSSPSPHFPSSFLTTIFAVAAMTSPSSSQMPYLQSATPFFPGGWPSPSEEAHDADLSTATYPIASDNRSEPDNVNEKTQRRWTYSGSTVSIPAVSTPVTPTSPDFKPLTASTSHNSRMSQLTENTVCSSGDHMPTNHSFTSLSAL